jgi:predicted HD phosphohydrolase
VRRVGQLVNRALRLGGLEIGPLRAPDPEALPSSDGGPNGSGTTESETCGAESEPPSTDPLRSEEETRSLFAQRAGPILERHRRQSRESVLLLRKRYSEPVFGKVRVWDLVERLGGCVDPTDQRLFGASQQLHVRQMLDAMETDGFATPEWVLVALIHDLGKVLLLTDEDPANVVCMNGPIGEHDAGAGLDNCLIQWNHDEFAYERFKDLIPDELAWLIRYHSLEIGRARHLMDDRDRERTARLLEPFAHYDHATKTPFGLPGTPLERYRDIVEEAFPDPIRF